MAANLSQIFVGLFNAATGGYANQYKASDANALASVVSIVAGQDLSSDVAYVNYVLGNLGVPATGAVHDAAFAAVTGLLATQGRGGAVAAAADYLANVAAKDATNQYNSVGKAFVAKVAVADAFTATHSSTVSVAQLVAGAAGNGGLAFTSGTDIITLTGTNNQISAVVDGVTTSKNTYGSADLLIGSSSDVLTVNANDDVTTTPTIKGVGTVNFVLNAVTTPTAGVAGATGFDVKADSIDKGTALSFDNIATITAIDTVAITGDLGGVRTVSKAFTTVTDDTKSDATFNLNAAGTIASPVSLTLSALAGNVTVNAAGNLSYTAATAAGLLQATAGGSSTISSAAAVVAILKSTGDLTVSDLSAAKSVTLTSDTGKVISSTSDKLHVATKIVATAAKTANIVSKAGTDVTLNATGTITSPSVLTNDGANTIKSITLSGNGGALVADLTSAGNKLTSLTINGSQPVTAELSAANLGSFTGGITNSGTSTVGVILNGVGSADFSGSKLDSLKISGDIGYGVGTTASVLTVANGQSINVAATLGTANGTVANGLVTIAGKVSTDSATLVLNDGVLDTNAVGLTAVTLKSLGSLTIDASQDKTGTGGASASTITSLIEDGNTDATNVTVLEGSNGITLTTVTLTAGNTLTVSGSGAITAAAGNGITAGTFDASNATGAVTMGGTTAVTPDKLPTILTGSAKDTVSLGANSTSSVVWTVKQGAGDDTLKLTASITGGNAIFDGGDGADTIVASNNISLTNGTGKTIAISNYENFQYTSANTTNPILTITDKIISGQAWSLSDAAIYDKSIVVSVGTTTTSIDLSGLTATTANLGTVKDDTFTVDASSSTTLTSFLGSNVTKNSYTGSTTTAATVVGGAYADTFTVQAGMGTFTGGAGNDGYDLSAATGATATKYVTITDFALNATSTTTADTLKLTTGSSGTNVGALTGWAATNGVLTKSGATLADFVTAVKADVSAANTLGDFYAAAIGGDLYIYDIGTTSKTASSDDVLVKLTGVAQLGIGVEAQTAAHAGYVTVVA